ncbi:endoribonuclease MazF [Candidatus Contubernalis alkaliaceticus]|uniref:endoribonuclease MazF n=1 Tax=Candidatus Contubernalis alkaliaceticus TaxID=338645 RepID=UPI001F4BE28F|nr:endoribonuclease MazF [Candidatus Contubernalis alkalaceticus]UNC91340.1 endoribonuclease MazF [Candidatus Contubernalis alkalaceticus]
MVKLKKYFPQRGDIVWLNFSPQTGHEQAGKRPAVCISPKEYNKKVGLAIFCPITSQVKGYPFEVILPKDCPVKGVILSDQVKNLDWSDRNVEFICTLPEDKLVEVLYKLEALIRRG